MPYNVNIDDRTYSLSIDRFAREHEGTYVCTLSGTGLDRVYTATVGMRAEGMLMYVLG